MASFEHKARSQCGFTLIETVVALLIVSLGMTALYVQFSQHASNVIYLREKTLASWIASNVLTELGMQSTWPELGDSEGEVEFAQQEWRYRLEITETEVENLRRAEVAVALLEDPDQIVHTVAALIEPPAPAGFAPLRWESVGGGFEGPGGGGTNGGLEGPGGELGGVLDRIQRGGPESQ